VAERPILKLPDPVIWQPRKRVGGGPKISRPSKQRQEERINPRFARLEQVADNPAEILTLREDPAAIAPERAIVFDVEGSIEDFYEQARAIGLEYLGDFEDEFDSTDDFYYSDDPDSRVSGRIYLAMPDVRALQELISLWKMYKRGRMPSGKGDWGALFRQLVDVRAWGPQDRVSSETLAFWQDELARAPNDPIRTEIELWFHENAVKRATAFAEIEAAVRAAGGAIVHHAVLSEIRYDAALADVPARHVHAIIANNAVGLAQVGEIMLLRPQSILRSLPEDEGEVVPDAEAAVPPPPMGAPIVALFDGLPVQNHARLVGRLDVDDPDDLEPTYPVAERTHGTEMASLIVHGDLSEGEPALGRTVHVRPILRPNGNGEERTPADRLVADVVYQAVRRLKEGSPGIAPTGPGVCIINFSLADEMRPFARIMSPLGRLIDYLSYRYSLLFLISAGNILHRIPVPEFRTTLDFEAATAEARETAILAAINGQRSLRTLLSPAESLNGITVGASHKGSAFDGTLFAGRYDPFTDESLPNVASALGLGFKKAVKPEILFPGGRAPVQIVASGDGIVLQPSRTGAQQFGLKAARPHRLGALRHEDFTWGTSVATALATRSAHKIHDMLLDSDGGSNHADIDPAIVPVALKALLVHSARWSEKAASFDRTWEPRGQGAYAARRDNITRFVGYGSCRPERVLDCDDNQAILLGYGLIDPDQALLYRLPLPSALDGERAIRTLSMTLAWLSPVNVRHQGYKMAALDLSAASDDKWWLTPERIVQPSDKAVARGTVYHEHRTGEDARVFVDDGQLMIRVTCRPNAGTLAAQVPYALAISFEVAVEAGISVYDDVRAQVMPRVPAT
jgi:Subtilase family